MVAASIANMEVGDNQHTAKEGGQICVPSSDLDQEANLHLDTGASVNLPKLSLTEAGEKLNVSEKSVRTAKQVKEKGSPELVAAVESGKVAVSDAVVVVDLTTDADIIYFPFAIPMVEYFVPLVMTTAPSWPL
jgi:hypothetical protein